MASEHKLTKSVRKWLQDANLSSHSIDLLILNGYIQTDLFICCNDNDIEGIAKDYNIPILDKIKLKLAIHRHKNNNNQQVSHISDFAQRPIMEPSIVIKSINMNKQQRNGPPLLIEDDKILVSTIEGSENMIANKNINIENNQNENKYLITKKMSHTNTKSHTVSIEIQKENNNNTKPNTKKRTFNQCNSNQQNNLNDCEPQKKKKKLNLIFQIKKESQIDKREHLPVPNLCEIGIDNSIKGKVIMTHTVNSNTSKQYATISQEMTKRGHKFEVQYHVSVHCHICRQYFVDFGKYSSHLKKHYNQDPNKLWLHCDLGHKRIFTTGRGFLGHIATHTNDKPFKCDYPGCESSKITKPELTEHYYVFHVNKDKTNEIQVEIKGKDSQNRCLHMPANASDKQVNDDQLRQVIGGNNKELNKEKTQINDEPVIPLLEALSSNKRRQKRSRSTSSDRRINNKRETYKHRKHKRSHNRDKSKSSKSKSRDRKDKSNRKDKSKRGDKHNRDRERDMDRYKTHNKRDRDQREVCRFDHSCEYGLSCKFHHNKRDIEYFKSNNIDINANLNNAEMEEGEIRETDTLFPVAILPTYGGYFTPDPRDRNNNKRNTDMGR